jgi:hypothetical protein
MRVRGAIAVAILLAAIAALAATGAEAGTGRPAEIEARQVVRQFFQTLNHGQFAKTCDLLSKAFYRVNHIPDKHRCAIALAATFSYTATVLVRVLRIRSERGQVIVDALANGDPGTILLIREHGRLKILSMTGRSRR